MATVTKARLEQLESIERQHERVQAELAEYRRKSLVFDGILDEIISVASSEYGTVVIGRSPGYSIAMNTGSIGPYVHSPQPPYEERLEEALRQAHSESTDLQCRIRAVIAVANFAKLHK